MQKNRTLGEFIETLASGSSTPGGGSASALAGAMGAALVSMVANLTIGKKGYVEFDEDMQEVKEATEYLCKRFLEAIDEDIAAFNNVMQHYRKPKQEGAEEQHTRQRVLEGALKQAAGVPLECMRLSIETLDVASVVAEKGNVNVLSDAEAAVYMAAATFYSSKTNVLVNLTSIRDELYCRHTLKEMAYLESTFREAFKVAVETVVNRREDEE